MQSILSTRNLSMAIRALRTVLLKRIHTGNCIYPTTTPVVSIHRLLSTMETKGVFEGPGSEELRSMNCSDLGKCDKLHRGKVGSDVHLRSSRNTPKVPEDDLPKRLASIPAWSLSEDKSSIHRKFVARNFIAAINFFNEVAKVAEEQGHHPDLHLTDYRTVEIVLSTHAIGALSLLDFIMAARLDAIDVEYSPKWLQKMQEKSKEGDE